MRATPSGCEPRCSTVDRRSIRERHLYDVWFAHEGEGSDRADLGTVAPPRLATYSPIVMVNAAAVRTSGTAVRATRILVSSEALPRYARHEHRSSGPLVGAARVGSWAVSGR